MPVAEFATVDYHTGGEPFRIVMPVAGAGGNAVADVLSGRAGHTTVAERRMAAIASPEVQRVRRILCSEPRGHADMYGGFLTPPDDAGADFGVLFWHKDGFSTACGHGTIALGTWAVESGRVRADPDGDTDVVIDVPSGRVTARVTCAGGRVDSAAFLGVSSWVADRRVPLVLPGRTVEVDIAYAGAFYASLPASALDLTVEPARYADLVDAGRRIKHAADTHPAARHPSDDRLSGIYGTILYDEAAGATAAGAAVRQRNLTVFADGQADRSPCGSGTCARMALLAASGTLTMSNSLIHTSIVGSTFTGRIRGFTSEFGNDAVVPEVTGSAYRTGRSTFVVDDRDELAEGFVLR
ncbi:proline racemase family protein [Spelaeicoccus albus]|nr:proline racemase family protein [Spelaeicoccus albus]